MSTTAISEWDDDKIRQIRECLQRGQKEFALAGELVVEIIEKTGKSLEDLSGALNIPMDILAKLERIGRKQLNPELWMADFAAASKMMRLPLSEQNRLMREPVEVFVMKDGNPDKMCLPVAVLTAPQVKQVFARNYVRPLAEQRAWIEAQVVPPSKETTKRDVPYEITRRHTVIIGGNEFTVAELLRIAAMAQD